VNHKSVALFLLALALSAAACSASPATATILAATATAPEPPAANPTSAPANAPSANLARSDAQGTVEFVVTPLNLSSPGETLDFDVAMNTHSVDLAWDLAAQSTLATDTGLEVKGTSWPVGSGHHYEGTLTFPARTADGQPLLDGAKTLTLTITDADAPERVFEWDLAQ
jgi:hypothetical protein